MREILFRARDKNGKWRFGNLQKFKLNGAFCEITAHGLTGESRSYLCASNTVGQYTGLTDKHGTKIFEGDICKFYDDDGETSLYACEWDKLNCRFAIRFLEADCGIDDLETGFAENCKVIGNIYDNFKQIGDDDISNFS